jgi:hypothetical protein
MSESSEDEGVAAIATIYAALKPLDAKVRQHVLDYVLKRLEIQLDLKSEEERRDQTIENTLVKNRDRNAPADENKILDLRSLAQSKNPHTVNEKVALVAYYLKHHAPADERRDYIGSDDIARYFVEAGFELPTAPPSMTLTHAKNAGYLNQAERGQWRLNPVGHNLVAHKLPAEDSKPARRSKRAAKKAVKKKKR